jgi:sulfate adenylyltransferase large subunit
MEMESLGFVIVGHVDHGKSTLIGRLLCDTQSLPREKLEEVERMSKELGRPVELAFVMDHLQEERDQGLTIDTAQAFFRTDKRGYVIIDAPGHKEFIKNMITGASQAQAALLIIDAEHGLREQTRRHACLLAMLGLTQLTVLINKMDKVSYARDRFDELASGILAFLDALRLKPLHVIPISARDGDNVASRSVRMPWYGGVTVLEALDSFKVPPRPPDKPMRFPVQDVYRLGDRCVLVGRVESGTIRTAQEIVFLPSGRETRVKSIEKFLVPAPGEAAAGESIGITIEDALVIERGEVACEKTSRPTVADTLRAEVFWMSPVRLTLGERLVIRQATQEAPANVVEITRRMDSSSLEVIAQHSEELRASEIAEVTIRTERPIVTEPFYDVPELGRFVLVRGHDIVAGGIVPS